MPSAPRDDPPRLESFGTLSTGEQVDLVRLRSQTLRVDLITWGARVISIHSQDSDGAFGEVTLGLADLAAYEGDRDYFGACVGRFANRIAGGSFTLDGAGYHLPTNEGPTTLHGGAEGFDRRLWQADVDPCSAAVRLHRISESGEMGFPGRLEAAVSYRVDGSDLVVEYEASTSMPTLVNLTNHTYFNLSGSGSVEEHVITVDGSRFLPVDSALLPTGEIRSVDGTPFDLRRPTRIGDSIRAEDEQVRITRGFDHTWVLGDGVEPVIDAPGDGTKLAARVGDPRSGRWLEVWTDRPGIQFYSGNVLDGSVQGRDGRAYRQTDGFCLEPHLFPDAPHHDHFPSATLWPGEVYRTHDVYRFGS